jgi:quinoprotein glucose dehydrogenase
MTEKDINPYAENKEELLATLRSIRHRNQFELPSKQGTLIFPGYDGGGEWGGAGYDPETGLLYVNSNEMPWIMKLVEKPKADKLAQLPTGERAYVQYCTACHGTDRKGNVKSGYPSLIDIGTRRDRAFLQNIIKGGKGMMPGFSYLTENERTALVAYMLGEEKKEVGSAAVIDKFPSVPYKMTGYNKFLDKNGYPAINPPWGQLSAINLNTGEFAWKITLG